MERNHRSGFAGCVGRAADAHRALLVAADDLELDRQAALGEDLGQGVWRVERLAGRLDEQVTLADPGSCGGTAVLDATDQQARTLAQTDRCTEAAGDVWWRDRDPEPRPSDRFASFESVDALVQCRVGGPGEVEPLTHPVGVDRDELSRRVDQRTAG